MPIKFSYSSWSLIDAVMQSIGAKCEGFWVRGGYSVIVGNLILFWLIFDLEVPRVMSILVEIYINRLCLISTSFVHTANVHVLHKSCGKTVSKCISLLILFLYIQHLIQCLSIQADQVMIQWCITEYLVQ